MCRSFRVGVRILHRLIFSFKIIYFHRYITLDCSSEADNWHGFESEIGDFVVIGEPISFIILEL